MKKILLIVAALAVFTLMSCENTSTPVDPPAVVPPSWEEVVVGNFWQVEGIEKYQDTRSLMANPYEKGVCMYFGDGEITFWDDANGDGLISPSEEILTPIPYDVTGGVLTIGADEWEIDSFTGGGWSMQADVTGTTLGDWLGGSGEPYEGWVRVHYIPCLLAWDGPKTEIDFAFVFDDMGDANAEWVQGFCHHHPYWYQSVTVDFIDGFYFTFGDVDIVIAAYYENHSTNIDTAIFIGSDEYGVEVFGTLTGFKPNHVYDMNIAVDSADVALFTFVSRVDGSGFTVDARIDKSALGGVVIRGVNDVDVPVVNP